MAKPIMVVPLVREAKKSGYDLVPIGDGRYEYHYDDGRVVQSEFKWHRPQK